MRCSSRKRDGGSRFASDSVEKKKRNVITRLLFELLFFKYSCNTPNHEMTGHGYMTAFIPVSQPSISNTEIDYVTDAVRSGWVSSLGPYIEQFEHRFAELCGSKYALTTCNGTTALHLALVSLGVKPGDEVIVPDLTFVATANAVACAGATPVTVDVDAETLCLSPEAFECAITPRTRAVIPVHLYGHPSDMDAINAIAKAHKLFVIEDAAEAHAAEYKGRPVGSLGCCGVFSFYGNKIITSGEGGMITTDDETLYNTARRLRDHAMSPTKRYWHEEIGYNYRMTNLQAALGVAQLDRFADLSARRKELMDWYRGYLGHRADIRLNRQASWAKSAHWMLCLEIDHLTDASRQRLMSDLRTRSIDSRPYFYPVSDLPMYPDANTPVSHRIAPTGLNLPFYVGLKREEVEFICRQFEQALDGLAHHE
ncbi:GDP-perosamine synthase [Gammaproteobacteria bacterium]